MPIEDDKKMLSQATGIPTHSETLVLKACKVALALSDALLAKRGFEPGAIRAAAEKIANNVLPPPTVPAVEEPVPEELLEPAPAPEPVEAKNPGHLSYDDLNAMTKNELKDVAKDCGLSTIGTKNELFNAVAEYLGLVE